MKNLPEDELFSALESRIRSYNDEPDEEVWKKIADELSRSREPGWIVWAHRIAAVYLFSCLSLMFYSERSLPEPLTNTESVSSQPASKGLPLRIPTTTDEDSKMSQLHATDGELKNAFLRKGQLKASFNGLQPLLMENDENIDNRLGASVSQLLPRDSSGDGEKQDQTVTDSILVEPRANLVQVEGAQRELPGGKRKGKSRVTVYTMITPLLSFSHASPHGSDNIVIEKLNSPPVLSMERLGISMEVGVQGVINRRWQYLAGISYYHQSHNITYEQQSEGNVIITPQDDMSYTIQPGTTEKSVAYSMHNIGVQAGILYSLKQHGLHHKAGVVLQYQKGLAQGREGAPYSNAASNYLNYQLLYRVEYKLNAQTSFFLQPSFTHSLISNESLDVPFNLKQSRAGIGIGIVYSF